MKNDAPLLSQYKNVYYLFKLIAHSGLFDTDRKKNISNEYFHHADKGCILINQNKYCLTHKVDVCRCGWQVGYHFGTCSKKMPKYYRKKLKNYGRGICIEKGCNKPVLALGLCSQHYTAYNRKLALQKKQE